MKNLTHKNESSELDLAGFMEVIPKEENIPVLMKRISLFVIASFMVLLFLEGSLSANLLSNNNYISKDEYISDEVTVSEKGENQTLGDVPANESLNDPRENEKKSIGKRIGEWFSFESSAPVPQPNVNQYQGMVQFISGLIVVYIPDVKNAGELAREIVEAGRRENVDPLYIAAIISAESGFSVTARSRVGASGLMQLMPRTAQEISEKITGEKTPPKLNDPKTNILLGVRYIKYLQKKYNNQRHYALAAYNWGPGNVDKVRAGEKEIPGSVSDYARKILLRTSNWNKHYYQASRGEALLLAGR